MTPLIFASALALFRAALSSSDPLFPTDGSAGGPLPVNGVWAALPAACETPTSLDLTTWPKCATPIGFLDGELAALQKPGPGTRATATQYYAIARTKFWVAKSTPDSPAIVQVDVPILLSSAVVYIAITPDSLDEGGRFVAATGWPILCPPVTVMIEGVHNDGGHCSVTTVGGVSAAAAITPDPSKTYRLVRITGEAVVGTPASNLPVPPQPAEAPVAEAAPSAAQTSEAAPMADPDAPPAPSAGSPEAAPPTAAPREVMETALPPADDATPSAQPLAAPHTG
jgi:hypothetical protein